MRCHVLIRELEHAEWFRKNPSQRTKLFSIVYLIHSFLHFIKCVLHAYNHLMLLGYIDVE